MLEYYVVDDRNVKRGENRDEAEDDGPEQELVAAHVVDPLREVLLAPWLHSEEAPPHIDEFPGQEESEPSQASETGRAGTEHGVAFFRVGIIAVYSKIAITETEKNERECSQAECGDPEAICKHIDHDFECEDASL